MATSPRSRGRHPELPATGTTSGQPISLASITGTVAQVTTTARSPSPERNPTTTGVSLTDSRNPTTTGVSPTDPDLLRPVLAGPDLHPARTGAAIFSDRVSTTSPDSIRIHDEQPPSLAWANPSRLLHRRVSAGKSGKKESRRPALLDVSGRSGGQLATARFEGPCVEAWERTRCGGVCPLLPRLTACLRLWQRADAENGQAVRRPRRTSRPIYPHRPTRG
jgi:hypothetical protein